ncbi:MAG TPA: DUF2726 domain-containing protein [Verrucomicrobiae bacterium]|nr:DUF2726 domain-containing protein [Verrucomicrobiae bacterium]
MNYLIALGVLFFVAVIALSVLAKVLPSRRPALPYKKRDYLLTAAERSFYEVLCSITRGQVHAFPKVRLLDLLYLPKGTENSQGYKNRVMSKHVDFVLCDLENIRPLLVVELDDSSHEREDRKERDAFVDEALAAAGLPILHVKARQSYDPKELARQIEERLQAGTHAAGCL